MSESIILDFLNDSKQEKEPKIKSVKKVEFGINHYRSIIQNRIIINKERGCDEVVTELMKLLASISTFGRDAKNVPRDIIDFIIVKRGQTYKQVFEPNEGSTRPNQDKEFSFTRKLIAFFLYKFSGIPMEGIAEYYLKQTRQNIRYMINDIRIMIDKDEDVEEIYELNEAIYDYLTTLYPNSRNKIKNI